MRYRWTHSTIFAIGFLFLAIALPQAQKPTDNKVAAAEATPAPPPQITPAEDIYRQSLNDRYKQLQDQIDALKRQQDAIAEEAQTFSKAITGEHPGFYLNPQNGAMMPIQNPAQAPAPQPSPAAPATKK